MNGYGDHVKPAPRPKAAEAVAAQLRSRIVRGVLEEGEVLPPESELLVEFGLSRPTLREAIRVLEMESLVTVSRGARGGLRVSVPQTETAARYAGLVLQFRGATTADVFAAACEVEAPCAALVARSRTSDTLARLREAVDAEEAAVGDPELLLNLQNGFHRLIIQAAGNETMNVLSDILRSIIETATRRYLAQTIGRSDVRMPASRAGLRAHMKLVDLIEMCDSDGAETLWRKQILATGDHLLKSGVGPTVLDLLD